MADKFSINRFLDDRVGAGIQPVQALFENTGHEVPNYDTVRKWRARDSMPPAWLVKLFHALEIADGNPVSLAPWFSTDKETDPTCTSSKKKRASSGSQPSVFD